MLEKEEKQVVIGLINLSGILLISAIVLFNLEPTCNNNEESSGNKLGQYFNNASMSVPVAPGESPPTNQFQPPSNDGNGGENSLSSSYGSSYGSYSPNVPSQSGNPGDSNSGSSHGSPSNSYGVWYGSGSLSGSQSQYNPDDGNVPSSTSNPKPTYVPIPENQVDTSSGEPIHSTDTTKIPQDTWTSSFQCGMQEIKPSTRVVGGSVAIAHSWPWAVQVMYSQYGSPFMPICGGTIVSPRHVISALHCFDKPNRSFKIGVAKHLTHSREEGTEEAIAKIRFHPYGSADGNYPYNDLVLITLERELQFGKTIQPACLPAKDKIVREGSMCWAYGWGQTQQTGGEDYLKQVELEVLNQHECLKNFADAGSDEFAVCAGDEVGKDTCQGDSGGPFTCKESGKWILYGVTSFGVSCGVGIGSVYASVSRAMSWYCCFLDQLPECVGVVCDSTDFRHVDPTYIYFYFPG